MASVDQISHWLVALIWLARLACFWAIKKLDTSEDTATKTVNPEFVAFSHHRSTSLTLFNRSSFFLSIVALSLGTLVPFAG